MDNSRNSSETFNKHARLYQEKYGHLTLYEETYDKFCDLLTKRGSHVLDAACGPGNVSRYLLNRRPDLQVLGIDLAPQMLELAREAVPLARFAEHDCRDLLGLGKSFDGIICAFGFPYLSREEVVQFIRSAACVLSFGGGLYISTMEGTYDHSGFESTSTGNKIYVNYHSEQDIVSALEGHGFLIVDICRMASPNPSSKQTNDLFIIAAKT